jgi:O-acetyl-ADP-ribose deacetylase (regulator of RNase III)
MKYVEGNLITLAEDGKFDIIVHGCNCFCTMGAGIAKQIAEKLPNARRVDSMTMKGDRNKLGMITQARVSGQALRQIAPSVRGVKPINYNFTVINAYTQYGMNPAEKSVDYQAVYNAFKQIKLLYDMDVKYKIGIPQIGAGLAGGNWDAIEQIIDSLNFSDLSCVIFK